MTTQRLAKAVEVQHRVARITTAKGVFYAWQSDYERHNGNIGAMDNDCCLYHEGSSGWSDLDAYFHGREPASVNR